MGKAFTALGWVLTRGLLVALLLGPQSWVRGDLAYFATSVRDLPSVGVGNTLVEYPLLAVALLAAPWQVARATGAYEVGLVAMFLVADAAFTMVLWRVGSRGRVEAVAVWLLGVPLLGSTALARFDVVPGVIAGAGLLLVASRPRLAAGAVTVAAALKLWPALLLPVIVARSGSRRGKVLVVVVLGGGMVAASLVVAGMDRLISPLTWQSDRGLQIESVLATPVMAAWALGSPDHAVAYSAYNAYEISGPGVGLLLDVASGLVVAVVVGLLLLWAMAWRRGAVVTSDAVVWCSLAAVSAFIVVNRVLSPQYLLWLLPLAAAALIVVPEAQGVRGASSARRLRIWVVTLLVATGTTSLVFPWGYGHLITFDGASKWVVLTLAARNLLLVGLFLAAAGEAVRHVGGRHQVGGGHQPLGGGPEPVGGGHQPLGVVPVSGEERSTATQQDQQA